MTELKSSRRAFLKRDAQKETSRVREPARQVTKGSTCFAPGVGRNQCEWILLRELGGGGRGRERGLGEGHKSG